MIKKPTRVSANSSTLPKDSILVKSGPSPVITTLTNTTNFRFMKALNDCQNDGSFT